ncbi:PhoX family protein [Kushneria konosiri]|uniref:dTDP-glucose 4,6-dehydratase n=1 Tax=Kushneria konosiri TaxID=698828 RepID=A0A2Z2H3V3_9GAMM|nr:PhoX family phosphatase [Kushneria konosiri]ARS51919.1 dTDP-glucose 4,6-dehydratase [Kushneria konosiri]
MSQEIENHDNHNDSDNRPFSSVMARYMSRRRMLQGSLGLAAATLFTDFGLGSVIRQAGAEPGRRLTLGFESLPGSMTDGIVVPEGYTAQVLVPWGTPLDSSAARWQQDLRVTPAFQARAMGMHHDGMYHFPLDTQHASRDFLLAINHEYIDQSALWAPQGGPTHKDEGARPADEVRTEINAHGVAIVRLRRDDQGHWGPVADDAHNRRITSATPMALAGPVAGTPWVVTAWSPEGTHVRGTNNNCASGYTPWGTYLTCEENWPEVFINRGELTADQARLGINGERGRYGWESAEHGEQGEFSRFDNTPQGDDPARDYRNEARGFGYIVEIDPYAPDSTIYKRTALGRFRHEGCWPGRVVEGMPLTFYTGHDSRNEYIYKFVTKKHWQQSDANRPGDTYDRQAIGASYLDEGTLYVARFDADGTGEWLPLTVDAVIPQGEHKGQRLGELFEDQAGIIVNTCDAADLMGATPMDRPEWGTVDPQSGMVYMTLTNNSKRTDEDSSASFTGEGDDVSAMGSGYATAPVNAANPRPDNTYGHIIRWQESHDDPTRMRWEPFVFGGSPDAQDDTNPSGLTDVNAFASPDGLWFDERDNGEGILWIETDNGLDKGRENAVANMTNDQVLAVVPGAMNEKGQPAINAGNQAQLKRFAIGPNEAEVTGIFATPDRTALFINIQHPANWPAADTDDATQTAQGQVRPRSSTVVIQKRDGGMIGV